LDWREDDLNIVIIGSGLIGQAWAIVFARAGLNVRLWDNHTAALSQAKSLVANQLRELQVQQLVKNAEQAIDQISIAASLHEALEDADYVQENLPENLDIKCELYTKMDDIAAPHTILASSTSGIPASAFTQSLAGRHRCLVAHPVNPPYLIPVVELCGAPWTDPTAIQTTHDLMMRVGQKPVTVNHEIQGFVLNRLQGALLREAFRLVEQGVISVQDLDTTVKDGLGLRWSFMGPFETIDLNAPAGLADYCQRYGPMYQEMFDHLGDTKPWSEDLINDVEAQRREALPTAKLTARRLWRDERLMALMRHKRSADTDNSDHHLDNERN
jgi:3-hydroxyacyl-CoA dehydrogenase